MNSIIAFWKWVENQTKTWAWEDPSLCPETSTKTAVQEFYLRVLPIYSSVLNLLLTLITVIQASPRKKILWMSCRREPSIWKSGKGDPAIPIFFTSVVDPDPNWFCRLDTDPKSWMFSFEGGFSSSFNVLYGGIGINKLRFKKMIFSAAKFAIFGHQNHGSGSETGSGSALKPMRMRNSCHLVC